MALEDLIIDQKQITTALIEDILKGRVELIRETKGVHLSKDSSKFSTKTKILLFLAGKHAWELLNNDGAKMVSSLDEISKETGVFGSTLRNALKGLKDVHLANSEASKYYIQPKGMHALEEWIKAESVKETHRNTTQSLGSSKAKSSKGTSAGRAEVLQTIKEKPFAGEYVTKMLPYLRKAKNPDKYLLVIYMAKEATGIEGLTPSEVNYLLTEPPIALPSKFYVTNISRDLGSKLRDYVNPYKAGNAYEYKLNTPGKEHVDELINNTQV